jgi:hypothetical protein
LDSLIQVGGLNQIEPCQTLLRFRERAIRDGHLPLPDPHSFSAMNGLKGFRRKASSSVSQGLVVSHTRVVGHGPDFFFFTIDKAYVFQSRFSSGRINFQPQYNNRS